MSTAYSYVDRIELYAVHATNKPSDFGYWGNPEMFKTWGFAGFDKHGGSNTIEISNFDRISEDLKKKFPDDFVIERYNHWAFNHIYSLCVRVYEDEQSKKITEAFYAAMEIQDRMRDEILYDEDHFYDLEYAAKMELIVDWNVYNPGYIYTESFDRDWAWDLLDCLDSYIYTPSDMFPDNDQIMQAIYDLELANKDTYDEWKAWTIKKNLDMPKFANPIVENPDQLKLFETE